MSPSQPSLAARNSVRGIVRIDPKVIEHHLRRIYERENPSGAWIESGMYRAVRDILESAVDEGTSSSQQAAVSPVANGQQPSLAAALKRSADVFAAHKVHRIQQDMARLLVDDQGNLRSFREWRELVTPIAAHQVGPWLETEYSTAVLRAQQAVEWQQFEAEADVLPNLRWVPSTAVHPGADHQVFWNTILPIHHPFWDQHRPGDRWNCHCSLEATDEQPTAPPKGYELRGNGPQPGLNENPAKTGRLFAQSHPYFPQTCAQCAFYQGGIANGFKNQERDCIQCRQLAGLIKLSPKEKHEIYEKPLEEQFEEFMPGHFPHSIKIHVLRPRTGDYERVLDAAKLYAQQSEVLILPEIHKSEKAIRQRLGLKSETANPDLKVGDEFVDVKSPLQFSNVRRNANDATKQGGKACVKDDFFTIDLNSLEYLAKEILKDESYLESEVHFIIKGTLYKYNSQGRIPG